MFFEGQSNHSRIIREYVAKTVPTYFCRYEDLLLRSTEVMNEILCFLLNVDSIEGTVAEKRVLKFTKKEKDNEQAALYKLKSANNNQFGRNAHLYNEEQIEMMKTDLKQFNHFFGYANAPNGDENPTGVLKYTPEEQTEVKELFMGYREHNRQVLKEIAHKNHAESSFRVNGKEALWSSWTILPRWFHNLGKMEPIEAEQP